MPLKSETLHYQDGASDKLYSLCIQIADAVQQTYDVVALFGRRGGTMQQDLKTKKGPVSLAVAQALYNKTLNEKRAKGYRSTSEVVDVEIVETPSLAAGPSLPLPTPVGARDGKGAIAGLPGHMLLTEVGKTELERLFEDDRWIAQPKFDGVRVRVIKEGAKVKALSRTQRPVNLPKVIIAEALLHPDFVLDGELIGDELVIFDVLAWDGEPVHQIRYELRLSWLNGLPFQSPMTVTVTAATTQEKRLLHESVFAKGMEGVVFKRTDTPYTAGRVKTAVKYKFWATASVIAGDQRGDKSSVSMHLADGTLVGAVTITGKLPTKGSVIEVRYLYRGSEDGHLVQSVFLGVREDILPGDCTAKQFQVKNKERAA